MASKWKLLREAIVTQSNERIEQKKVWENLDGDLNRARELLKVTKLTQTIAELERKQSSLQNQRKKLEVPIRELREQPSREVMARNTINVRRKQSELSRVAAQKWKMTEELDIRNRRLKQPRGEVLNTFKRNLYPMKRRASTSTDNRSAIKKVEKGGIANPITEIGLKSNSTMVCDYGDTSEYCLKITEGERSKEKSYISNDANAYHVTSQEHLSEEEEDAECYPTEVNSTLNNALSRMDLYDTKEGLAEMKHDRRIEHRTDEKLSSTVKSSDRLNDAVQEYVLLASLQEKKKEMDILNTMKKRTRDESPRTGKNIAEKVERLKAHQTHELKILSMRVKYRALLRAAKLTWQKLEFQETREKVRKKNLVKHTQMLTDYQQLVTTQRLSRSKQFSYFEFLEAQKQTDDDSQ